MKKSQFVIDTLISAANYNEQQASFARENAEELKTRALVAEKEADDFAAKARELREAAGDSWADVIKISKGELVDVALLREGRDASVSEVASRAALDFARKL
jgi:hypothetical protein